MYRPCSCQHCNNTGSGHQQDNALQGNTGTRHASSTVTTPQVAVSIEAIGVAVGTKTVQADLSFLLHSKTHCKVAHHHASIPPDSLQAFFHFMLRDLHLGHTACVWKIITRPRCFVFTTYDSDTHVLVSGKGECIDLSQCQVFASTLVQVDVSILIFDDRYLRFSLQNE